MGRKSRTKRQRRRGDIEQMSADAAATTEDIARLNARIVRLVRSIEAMPKNQDAEGATRTRFEKLYTEATVGLLMSTAHLMALYSDKESRKTLKKLMDAHEKYDLPTYTAAVAIVILKMAAQEAKWAVAEKTAAAEQAKLKDNAKKSTGTGARDWNAERDPDVLAEAALAKAQHLMAAAVRDSGVSDIDVALRTGRSPKETAKLYRSDAELTVRTLAREVAVRGRRLKLDTEKLPETES